MRGNHERRERHESAIESKKEPRFELILLPQIFLPSIASAEKIELRPQLDDGDLVLFSDGKPTSYRIKRHHGRRRVMVPEDAAVLFPGIDIRPRRDDLAGVPVDQSRVLVKCDDVISADRHHRPNDVIHLDHALKAIVVQAKDTQMARREVRVVFFSEILTFRGTR